MTDPDDAVPGPAADSATDDGEGFWRLGPLPMTGDDPVSGPSAVAPERLGRPDVTVDGRNLADVLRPVYRVITAD
jgi:hypothetical protein